MVLAIYCHSWLEFEQPCAQVCWPSAWLAQDLPQARLLSMEYAAPASGWEVRSAVHSMRSGQLRPSRTLTLALT